MSIDPALVATIASGATAGAAALFRQYERGRMGSSRNGATISGQQESLLVLRAIDLTLKETIVVGRENQRIILEGLTKANEALARLLDRRDHET